MQPGIISLQIYQDLTLQWHIYISNMLMVQSIPETYFVKSTCRKNLKNPDTWKNCYNYTYPEPWTIFCFNLPFMYVSKRCRWNGNQCRPPSSGSKLFPQTYLIENLSHDKVTVRPVKAQISLGIRPVWSASSLCTQWVAKDPSFLHVDSEDSDQTGGCPGWSEFSLGAQSLSWFCRVVAHLVSLCNIAISL